MLFVGEKVLVKAKFSSINIISVMCFVIAAVALLVCFLIARIFGGKYGIMWAFVGMEYGYYWFFIGIAVFLVLGFSLMGKKPELIVTTNRVTGKTLFNKRVDLPISQVSAIGSGSFNRVTVTTASGNITFLAVQNNDEVFHVVSDLLVKRQNETNVSKSIINGVTSSNADELKKYKELLESGAITQEEFEAKKKQLLGL